MGKNYILFYFKKNIEWVRIVYFLFLKKYRMGENYIIFYFKKNIDHQVEINFYIIFKNNIVLAIILFVQKIWCTNKKYCVIACTLQPKVGAYLCSKRKQTALEDCV